MLDLQTLGDLSLSSNGKCINLTTKRQYALVVLLAANAGRTMRRDYLIECLWGDPTSRRARHSLSQTLYQLRRSAPELALEVSNTAIRLSPAIIEADFVAFDRAIQVRDFPKAVALYHGEFLDDFWISGAVGFERWHEAMRERLRQQFQFALHQRLVLSEQHGDWHEVERIAKRLLEYDPYVEEIHRARIQAITADGDHAQAAIIWKRVQDLFIRDLGRPPTGPAVEAIRACLQKPIIDDPELNEPLATESTRFIGRRTQFGILRQEWEKVRIGSGRLILITGESGIGKSRFSGRFLRFAAIHGARVLHGRCYATERNLAYSGMVNAIAPYITAKDLSSISPLWAHLISDLIPEICPSHPDTANTSHVGMRRHLFEGVVQLIKSMAANNPIILFLDDFHWTDDSTAQMLDYIRRHICSDPILIIAAFRREDVQVGSVLRQLLRHAGSDGGIKEIVLPQMGRDEIAELIAAYSEQHNVSFTSEFTDNLIARAGGRPFFLLEYLKDFANGLYESDYVVTLEEPEQLALPLPIEEYLMSRFEELDSHAAHLLGALAVVGKGVSPGMLRRLSGLDIVHSARGISQLVNKGILVESGTEVVFAHDLLREAAYRWIGGSRRRLFHERAAEVLSEDTSVSHATLATHFDLAGNRSRAFRHATIAARMSEEVYGLAEALKFLRMAAATADEAHDRIQSQERLAYFLYRHHRYAQAAECFSLLEDYYNRSSDGVGLLMAKVNRIELALQQGMFTADESVRRLQECVEIAESIGDKNVLGDVLRKLGMAAHNTCKSKIMLSVAEKLLDPALRPDQARDEILNLCVAATILGMYKSVDAGLAVNARAMELASELDDLGVRFSALRSRAKNRLQAGQIPQTLDDLQQAAALGKHVGSEPALTDLVLTDAVLRIECGDYEGAEEVLVRLSERAAKNYASHDLILARANLMLVKLECGNFAEAAALADQILFPNQVASAWWCNTTAWSVLGMCALARSDFADANRCRHEIMLRIDGKDSWVVDASYAEMFLARLGAVEGDLEAALERLERAIRAYEGRDVFCRSRLQLEYSRLLRSIDLAGSRHLAEQIRSYGLDIGARPLVAKANALLD